MQIYQLRVSIIGIAKVYRILEVSENCTFDELHEAIFQSFHRYDPHLYSFFITRKDSKNMREIMAAPEITHPQNLEDAWGFGRKRDRKSAARTKIGQAGLRPGDVIHYWFDFGDDWWHRIRVQSVREDSGKKKQIKLAKSVGESPPQYPEYDDEDFDE